MLLCPYFAMQLCSRVTSCYARCVLCCCECCICYAGLILFLSCCAVVFPSLARFGLCCRRWRACAMLPSCRACSSVPSCYENSALLCCEAACMAVLANRGQLEQFIRTTQLKAEGRRERAGQTAWCSRRNSGLLMRQCQLRGRISPFVKG